MQEAALIDQHSIVNSLFPIDSLTRVPGRLFWFELPNKFLLVLQWRQSIYQLIVRACKSIF